MQSDAAEWYANNIAVVAAIISGAAMLVSGAAVYWTRRQTKAQERQTALTEQALKAQADALRSESEKTAQALKLAERSTEAGEKAAEAAARNAEATRILAETGQRAWITVTGVEGVFPGGRPTPSGATVHIKNAGRTPAFRPSARYVLAAVPEDRIESMWNSFIAGFPSPRVLGPIGPGESDQFAYSIQFDASTSVQWHHVEEGAVKLVAMGELLYDDVFGKHRTVTWCYYYVLGGRRFLAYRDFNTAD